MTDEKAEKTSASTSSKKSKASAKASKPSEPKFSRERFLGSEARALTGYSRPDVAGALANEDGKTFTVNQVKAIVSKWLQTPVSS